MRVAIIVKEFPPDSIGGLQTQTKRMSSALAESTSRTDVVVFTKRYGEHDDDNLPFDVVRIPHLNITPFVSDLTFLLICLLTLLRHSRKIDCIQCMTIYPIGFLGLVVNILTDVPYFAWIRGNDFYQMRHVWWKRWMIERVLDDTRVLVQSPDIEADVREFFPELDPDIGVLGNGVSVPDRASGCDQETVLFVGRLAPKKGVQYLIEAMATISHDAELLIVGDGAMREQLESLAADLDVNAKFVGKVAPEEVDHYYRHAGVFVLPSLEGEGMPNAVLEAMAHGLPVVTTTSGGLPTMIDDEKNGFIVPMRDSQAIADRLNQLLESEVFRQDIGSNARSYAEKNHSWGSLTKELTEIYRRMI